MIQCDVVVMSFTVDSQWACRRWDWQSRQSGGGVFPAAARRKSWCKEPATCNADHACRWCTRHRRRATLRQVSVVHSQLILQLSRAWFKLHVHAQCCCWQVASLFWLLLNCLCRNVELMLYWTSDVLLWWHSKLKLNSNRLASHCKISVTERCYFHT